MACYSRTGYVVLLLNQEITFGEALEGFFGFGTWRGGTTAWGEQRVWLSPDDVPNDYGRGGFTIHGGSSPGSRGCIDLTSQMSSFAQRFKEYQKDIKV